MGEVVTWNDAIWPAFFPFAHSPRFFVDSDSTGATGTMQTRATTAKIINLLRSGNRSTFQLDRA
jgi:hypothetical protein